MATAARPDDLLETIAHMKIVDLTQTVEEGMPVYPTHPQFFHMRWHTGDPANMFQLLIGEHAGTHLDCPAHFYSKADDARHLSLEALPLEACIGPAVKLDFPGLDGRTELQADDIVRWEKAHERLQPGVAAIFSFGWERLWKRLPEGKAYLDSWPGITRDAAACLVERGVRLAGTDCLGIDGSATKDLGAHFTLLGSRTPIVENLRGLEDLPLRFLLLTLPLKIREGTGSPIRAAAMFVA
jgi:kynurenine formamidase